MISRIPQEVKMEYLPDFVDDTTYEGKYNNHIRRMRLAFTDGEKMGERYV